jgi:hypothetical protein
VCPGFTACAIDEAELAAVVCERTTLQPSEFRRLDVQERIWWLSKAADHPAEKHPIMTKPLTKKELADLFVCSRNDVQQAVLDKYPHEVCGTTARPKYRLSTAAMPAAYHAKIRLAGLPDSKK